MSAGVEGCVLLWWCDGRQPSEKLTTLTGFDSARLSDWWTAVRSTAFKLEAFMKCLKFDWSTSYGQTCFILSFLNWLLNCRFYNVQLFGGQYNTALLDLSPILQKKLYLPCSSLIKLTYNISISCISSWWILVPKGRVLGIVAMPKWHNLPKYIAKCARFNVNW